MVRLTRTTRQKRPVAAATPTGADTGADTAAPTSGVEHRRRRHRARRQLRIGKPARVSQLNRDLSTKGRVESEGMDRGLDKEGNRNPYRRSGDVYAIDQRGQQSAHAGVLRLVQHELIGKGAPIARNRSIRDGCHRDPTTGHLAVNARKLLQVGPAKRGGTHKGILQRQPRRQIDWVKGTHWTINLVSRTRKPFGVSAKKKIKKKRLSSCQRIDGIPLLQASLRLSLIGAFAPAWQF